MSDVTVKAENNRRKLTRNLSFAFITLCFSSGRLIMHSVSRYWRVRTGEVDGRAPGSVVYL